MGFILAFKGKGEGKCSKDEGFLRGLAQKTDDNNNNNNAFHS